MRSEWTVSDEESGVKLVAFLQSKLSHYSAKRLKKAIDHNACMVNGMTERFASTLLGRGDRVSLDTIWLQEAASTQIKFDSSRVLYEDGDLLVYNKPAGISSDSNGILGVVHQHESRAELVHRLDKDTTGALLFAKSKPVLDKFIATFRQQAIEKTYLAIVDGIPNQSSGKIENYLGRLHDYEGQTIWGEVPKSKKGMYALTEWHLESTADSAALLTCYPKTGRTHQIRAHLFEMGHPILGDYQYAGEFGCSLRPKRHLLHAWQLGFHHPVNDVYIEMQAPIPPDFQEAWKQLSGQSNRWIST